CVDGACTTSCPTGQLVCDGRCIDPETDRSFCGASGACTGADAGETCLDGEVCVAGICATSCPAGQLVCGDRCIDPETDRSFCGASGACTGADAGEVCLDGELCTAGVCVPNCSVGQTLCGDACTNLDYDPANCGRCGSTCPSGLCRLGVCACVYGSDCESGLCDDELCVTGCNLLVNGSAQAGDTSGWTILASGGSGWAVESWAPPPVERDSHNFVTSYALCRKSQLVSLATAGYSATQLETHPDIYVCDYVRRRWDGIRDTMDYFYIDTQLQDSSGTALESWSVGSATALQSTDSDAWVLHEHTYTGYAETPAAIHFEHGGRDGEGWAGHYGAKFDGARVTVLGMPCPSCHDGFQNQDETGIDCGGVCTTPCP
ncbi:MAG: hypothetical protein JXB32_22790, partial [Deltaproteobacteria bacterium]|nr:hypothetical protein [Deltaproteobacteria bacterium]